MSDAIYNEWAAESLVDRDDRLAWERQRAEDLALSVSPVSVREQVERWAAERAAVESQWPDGHEWRREALLAVAEKAAVLQTLREGNP